MHFSRMRSHSFHQMLQGDHSPRSTLKKSFSRGNLTTSERMIKQSILYEMKTSLKIRIQKAYKNFCDMIKISVIDFCLDWEYSWQDLMKHFRQF